MVVGYCIYSISAAGNVQSTCTYCMFCSVSVSAHIRSQKGIRSIAQPTPSALLQTALSTAKTQLWAACFKSPHRLPQHSFRLCLDSDCVAMLGVHFSTGPTRFTSAAGPIRTHQHQQQPTHPNPTRAHRPNPTRVTATTPPTPQRTSKPHRMCLAVTGCLWVRPAQL